jgi:hypothetical protein
MEVDRGACEGERVHPLGVQRSVDGCEPAALAVADEVDPPAGQHDRAIDDVEVVGDRHVPGLGGGGPPFHGVETGEPGVEDHGELALARGEVDDV